MNTQLDGVDIAALQTPEPISSEQAMRIGADWLKQQLAELLSRCEAERAEGVPDLAQLELKLSRAPKKVEKIQTKIRKAKRQAKQRKQEIAEWKLWCEGIGSMDKSEERAKLELEIQWRSVEIAAQETKISQLETEKLAALGDVERHAEQIEAVKAGIYDLPLEEDPRLLELQAAIDRTEQFQNS